MANRRISCNQLQQLAYAALYMPAGSPDFVDSYLHLLHIQLCG